MADCDVNPSVDQLPVSERRPPTLTDEKELSSVFSQDDNKTNNRRLGYIRKRQRFFIE